VGLGETMHKLFVDFNKACVSVARDILYSVDTGLGAPLKLRRVGGQGISGPLCYGSRADRKWQPMDVGSDNDPVVNTCLNESYCDVHTGKPIA
jgi:hypothetical protein